MSDCARLRIGISSAFATFIILAFALVALTFTTGCDEEEVATSAQVSPGQQAQVSYDEHARTPRCINIAYDDSTSMYGSQAWSQASYAIEVFAAMLGENDAMNVFMMSDAFNGSSEPRIRISGSESIEGRRNVAHSKLTDMNTDDKVLTNLVAAQNAFDDLKKKGDDGDKWLLVLTDGEFNYWDGLQDPEEIRKKVEDRLLEWADEDVHTEYIGMGDEADEFPSSGNLSSQHIDTEKILDKIIEESNKVFGRIELPVGSYDKSTQELDMKVSANKIIVLAQGEGAEIGAIEQIGLDAGEAGKNIVAKNTRVSCIDKPVDWAIPAGMENLKGEVSVFEGEFQRGSKWKLPISGDHFAIYCEPELDVQMTLNPLSGGEPVKLKMREGSPVDSGEYIATFNLFDPYSDEEIDRSLFNPLPEFETVLKDDNGKETSFKENDVITIEEGGKTITGRAVFNGEIEYNQPYNVVFLSDMIIDIDPTEPIDVHDLVPSYPINARVLKEGNIPLSEEEWANTSINVSSPQAEKPHGILGWLFGTPRGIDCDVAKSDTDPGAFQILLKAYNGKPAETLDGDVALHVEASRPVEGSNNSTGVTDTTVSIAGVGPIEGLLHWLRTHLVQLILLILLALVLAFLIMEARKPRIPRNLSPRIIGIEGEDELALAYNRRNTKHAIWPPWSPETGYFFVDVSGYDCDMDRRFELGGRRVDIVAAKGPGRAIRLSDSTLSEMQRQLDAYDDGSYVGEFPNPNYINHQSRFISGGGGFVVVGNKPHRRKGWSKPEETTYEIIF